MSDGESEEAEKKRGFVIDLSANKRGPGSDNEPDADGPPVLGGSTDEAEEIIQPVQIEADKDISRGGGLQIDISEHTEQQAAPVAKEAPLENQNFDDSNPYDSLNDGDGPRELPDEFKQGHTPEKKIELDSRKKMILGISGGAIGLLLIYVAYMLFNIMFLTEVPDDDKGKGDGGDVTRKATTLKEYNFADQTALVMSTDTYRNEADKKEGEVPQFTVNIANNYGLTPSMLNTDESFTIEWWMKIEHLPGLRRFYLTDSSSDGDQINLYIVKYKSGTHRIKFKLPSANSSKYAIAKIPNGEGWLHIAGVYSRRSKDFSLFVNGKLESRKDAEKTPRFSVAGLSMNLSKTDGSETKVYIDQLRVVKRAIYRNSFKPKQRFDLINETVMLIYFKQWEPEVTAYFKDKLKTEYGSFQNFPSDDDFANKYQVAVNARNYPKDTFVKENVDITDMLFYYGQLEEISEEKKLAVDKGVVFPDKLKQFIIDTQGQDKFDEIYAKFKGMSTRQKEKLIQDLSKLAD